MFDPIRTGGPDRVARWLGPEVPPVLGTTNDDLCIDRISSDAETIFGEEPEQIIGRSLLHLVASEGIGDLMWAVAETITSRHATCIHVPIVTAREHGAASCMELIPLVPAPSVAFAFAEDCPVSDAADSVDHLAIHITRGLRAKQHDTRAALQLGQYIPLAKLSARELEVVRRLWSGDRVPKIAADMFVCQSTVRNQLSSIYRKLGVGSQQGLIDFLRATEVS